MATMSPESNQNREPASTDPRGKETIMDLIMDLLSKLSCDEAGASAVEYGFLLAFIAVAIAASVNYVWPRPSSLFINIPQR